MPMPERLTDWRTCTQIQAKSLFHLVQTCATDLHAAGASNCGQVVACALLGGAWGRNGTSGAGLPTGGAANGLLKTLRIEWPAVPAKTIDFNVSLPPEHMAQCILDELLHPSLHTEIGYPTKVRTVFDPAPAVRTPTGPVQLEPQRDWVVLVTGGARGITAEITAELLVPGMTLILVGRAPEPQPETPLTAGIEDIARLRQVFLEQAKRKGEALKPVAIEQNIRDLLRDRTIRTNLAQFREQGALVEYCPVDVTHEAALGELIAGIYQRHGRLDAVIHGAGIIEDKRIVDKNPRSFDRVFDTKVDSIFLLSRYLRPERLKLLVLFGSVAGSFGNLGQVDYAAANELVNRFAWYLDRQWPQTRVVVLNWGPWDVTGMASDAVNEQFKARGVIPITPASGRRFFAEEIRYGHKGDTELVVGTFEGPSQEAYAVAALPIPSSALHPSALHHRPFLYTSEPQIQPNSTITLEHTFSLANDPYLEDHYLDGKLVLPAAGAQEWLAQFVQQAWPEWIVWGIQELRVLKGISFPREGSQSVVLRARAASHADAEQLEVQAEILDPARKLPFYRGTVLLRSQPPPPAPPQFPCLAGGTELDARQLYPDYLFHGPRFQLIQAICMDKTGADVTVLPSRPQDWVTGYTPTPWLFDPGVMDVSLQVALAWLRIYGGVSGLPTCFGKVLRYGQGALVGPLRINFCGREFNGQHFRYEAEVLDANGALCLQLLDIEGSCSAQLNRLNARWREENGYTSPNGSSL